MNRVRRSMGVGGLVATVALAGCFGLDDDLTQWMAQQRAQANPRIEPVRPPTAFQPESYQVDAELSPFSDDKLVRALRSDSSNPALSSLLLAEQRRAREPLEDVPLDAMAMVGSIQKGAQRVALVRANGLIHQVRVGSYLGQNLGRVTAISEHQITLREIVQDAAGEWVERTTTLQLLEGTGK
ncbi:MAG: pilus assembly protein PilP [Tepidimonas sp.]|uniref:pilus assembly protein PilP n=1 Tax=Tepidimonas sp. TaxID=2002775 RepID=UPI00298F19F4|nr:pilus assembly protein PilP [Tepidimonas sp.]MCS6809863.1 pilus assembly protein PilP [Tepidimonas sp.]MDW8335793.1 pilus assembly protein PilP [Tepidimonas sp.]